MKPNILSVSQTELSRTQPNPFLNILLTLLVVFVGFQLIGPFIGFFIAAPFYPESMQDMIKHMESPYGHPELRTPLLIMQGIGEIVGLLIMPAYLLNRQGVELRIFFRRPVYAVAAVIVVFIVLSFMIVDSPIAIWNEKVEFPEWMASFEKWARGWEDNLKKLTQYVTQFDSIGALMLGFVVIAILPAIGEEFVFRGLIQRDMLRGTGNVHVSIWITAIIFSAFHIQFFGFIPRMLLGALFGYLYHWSGSLVMPMIAHFINNGLIVISFYLYQQGYIEVDMEKQEAAPWTAVIASCFVLVALLYLYKKFYGQQPIHNEPPQENLTDSFD
jgi:uncharacterized protein